MGLHHFLNGLPAIVPVGRRPGNYENDESPERYSAAAAIRRGRIAGTAYLKL